MGAHTLQLRHGVTQKMTGERNLDYIRDATSLPPPPPPLIHSLRSIPTHLFWQDQCADSYLTGTCKSPIPMSDLSKRESGRYKSFHWVWGFRTGYRGRVVQGWIPDSFTLCTKVRVSPEEWRGGGGEGGGLRP